MNARIAPLFLALALTGCPETALVCDPGEVKNAAGDCVRDPVDSGTPQPDSGPEDDGGVDAGLVCEPACEGDTPHCVDLGGGDTGCVECEDHGDCGGGACVDNACVECEDHGDCTDPTRAQCSATGECVPCALPLHCSARTDGRTVCGEGACVECTATDRTACGSNACRPNGTCSEFGTAQAACLPCDTDANCGEGLLCIEMSFDDPTTTVVGAFCQWQRTATVIGAPNGTCGLTSQPFAETLPDAMSVDGFEADICTLATTTCPALLQHRTAVTGCNAATDDAACGVDGLRDGRCRVNTGGMPRCTYPCLGTEDCRTGSTCPVAGDQFCSI